MRGCPMNQRSQDSESTKTDNGLVRVAFIQSCWHKDIVDRCRESFSAELGKLGSPDDAVEFSEVPGAFEIPLQAQLLARAGRCAARNATASPGSPSLPSSAEKDSR